MINLENLNSAQLEEVLSNARSLYYAQRHKENLEAKEQREAQKKEFFKSNEFKEILKKLKEINNITVSETCEIDLEIENGLSLSENGRYLEYFVNSVRRYFKIHPKNLR